MEPPFGLGVKWRASTEEDADYYELLKEGYISLEPFYGEISGLFSEDVINNFTERYWSVKEDWIKDNIYYEDSIESYFELYEDMYEFDWYFDDYWFNEYYVFYGYDWMHMNDTTDSLNYCEHVE